ncbi:zinc finger MYND domain-containing protein 12 [Astyanax mexicanus]|uniref:zinc finger MYND domain-containing protein 12 n=1 Tax=Astyanax mexicanus TaxID=7994 RepID=UPI0020CAA27C|nr:zinc finger MYND domain-containing protein 12 [Astyanax mexicanus]
MEKSKMSESINPLASPKGVKRLCELCQKPAHLRCSHCRVTFYCDAAHQQADWNSIHKKACELLIHIRAPVPYLPLKADRDHQQTLAQKRLEQLMEVSRAEARVQVVEGRYTESLPAAQLSLHCAIDLYGHDAVELVPAYLLLAEANMGSGSLSKAQSYLSQAEWTVLKTPDCSQTVLLELHRNLGRLHTFTGSYQSALLHFANYVYYASEEFGLNSTETARGYFMMADVFGKQEKPDIASSLYSQVASTWHTHLSELFELRSQRGAQGEPCFDKAQCAEVDQMLRVMLEAHEQQQQQQHQDARAHPARSDSLPQAAVLSHSRAMLWFLCSNSSKALEFGRKALDCIQQCEQNSLAESIQSLINQAEDHLNTSTLSGSSPDRD